MNMEVSQDRRKRKNFYTVYCRYEDVFVVVVGNDYGDYDGDNDVD